MAKEKPEEIANKWIKELEDAGFSYDEMISIFKEAGRKYEDYKKIKNK